MPAKKSKAKKPSAKTSWFTRWYDAKKIRPVVKPLYLTGTEVRQEVTKQLGKKLAKNFGLYIADAEYFCPPVADAKEIIKNSGVDRNTWTKDKFDCDDFALVLKGHFSEAAYKNGNRRKPHCMGIVWGSLPGPHAINWMINSDRKLRFIEPQNDKVFFPRATDKNIYFMLV